MILKDKLILKDKYIQRGQFKNNRSCSIGGYGAGGVIPPSRLGSQVCLPRKVGTLGGPQGALGGPQGTLGGPQSALGGPQGALRGPQGALGGPQGTL